MGCITLEYKEILLEAFKVNIEPAIIAGIIQSMPLCSGTQAGGGKPTVVKTERAMAGQWPEANYYDKDGTVKTGSFSGLFKEKYGTPVTEDLICRWWGDKSECRSPSTVENFRNRGDIVKGNGEMAPLPTSDMSAGQVERLYKDWKDHLLKSNMKINIYHPEHPSIKEATKAVEKTSKKKVV